MNIRFDGKHALVTGVGKGIGRTIAIALSEAGATVHGISRTQADLDSLKEQVPSMHVYNVDLSDWEKTRTVIQNIGHIDLLVNNAAITFIDSFLETRKEDLKMLFSINVEAVYNVSQVVARGMVEAGHGGAIVNISSVGTFRPCKELSADCIAKAAIDMLTKCMALELGNHKIRVNSVNLTAVKTEMLVKVLEQAPSINEYLARAPYQQTAEMQDVANTTLYLLSDKANMITGSMIPVDGGLLIG